MIARHKNYDDGFYQQRTLERQDYFRHHPALQPSEFEQLSYQPRKSRRGFLLKAAGILAAGGLGWRFYSENKKQEKVEKEEHTLRKLSYATDSLKISTLNLTIYLIDYFKLSGSDSAHARYYPEELARTSDAYRGAAQPKEQQKHLRDLLIVCERTIRAIARLENNNDTKQPQSRDAHLALQNIRTEASRLHNLAKELDTDYEHYKAELAESNYLKDEHGVFFMTDGFTNSLLRYINDSDFPNHLRYIQTTHRLRNAPAQDYESYFTTPSWGDWDNL